MKLENVTRARILIAHRDELQKVIDRAEKWKAGHYEFVEHCSDHPNRIRLSYFPELTKKIHALVEEEIEMINKELEKL